MSQTTYEVHGFWDGLWWRLGAGSTVEKAEASARHWPDYDKVERRVMKVTMTRTIMKEENE